MWVMRTFFFLYSASVYSCHLFLISSASHMSIQFLSFIEPIFAWNFPLVSLIFLKRALALVFPILLFSSIFCTNHWGRFSYLSLLFFGTLYSNEYIVLFLLCFLFLFFSQLFICKSSLDGHFAFLDFFFLGMVLIPASCTMSRTSIHSSSGTLSIRSNPLNLSLPLYNHKGFD